MSTNSFPYHPLQLLTVEEATSFLNQGHTSLYKLLDEGALKSVRIGRSRRIVFADLLEFAQQLRQNAGLEPLNVSAACHACQMIAETGSPP